MIDDKVSSPDMEIQSKIKNKLYLGTGRITVALHGEKAVLSELSSTYPLKLLSPYIHGGTAIVYLLTYGGGLVGGDEVDLVVDVQLGARLVLLSQGTTKVFKSRLGRRLAYANTNESQSSMTQYPRPNDGFSLTKQNCRFVVASESILLLLPEPVTCFRDAAYNQIQRFEITEGGSAVILDWITSGRISRGEEWEFSRYYSVNDIWHNGKRVAKDITLLENHHDDRVPDRPLLNKLQPYSCYAMLILYGPRVHSIIRELTSQYDKISILKSDVPSLIWSISPIGSNGQGLVVRVGGVETETVKAWLKQVLSGIEHIMGKDVYRRIFS